jgi:hypothetical protein
VAEPVTRPAEDAPTAVELVRVDLVVTDKYTGEVATRVAQADAATIDLPHNPIPAGGGAACELLPFLGNCREAWML